MNAEINIQNIVLETERVILRAWQQSDLQDFNEYARVDGVGQRAGWFPHTSIAETQKVLDHFIEKKKVFAIQYKENQKVIGSLGLEKLSLDLGAPYTEMIGTEIGYVLSKDYWGKGIMPEAVRRAVRYCFDEVHMDYLLCSHSLTNQQSKRVIEKCGFVFIKEDMRTTQSEGEHLSRYYILQNIPESVEIR